MARPPSINASRQFARTRRRIPLQVKSGSSARFGRDGSLCLDSFRPRRTWASAGVGQKRAFTRIVEFLCSLFCRRHDREPAHDLNLPVRLDGMFGQERKNETGDFIVLLVQGEMAGVE
jgi:hypothetical protein